MKRKIDQPQVEEKVSRFEKPKTEGNKDTLQLDDLDAFASYHSLSRINPVTIRVECQDFYEETKVNALANKIISFLNNKSRWSNVTYVPLRWQNLGNKKWLCFTMNMNIDKHNTIGQENKIFIDMIKTLQNTFDEVTEVVLLGKFENVSEDDNILIDEQVYLAFPLKKPIVLRPNQWYLQQIEIMKKFTVWIQQFATIVKTVWTNLEAKGALVKLDAIHFILKEDLIKTKSIQELKDRLTDLKGLITECILNPKARRNYEVMATLNGAKKSALIYGLFREAHKNTETFLKLNMPKEVKDIIQSHLNKI